MSFRFTNRSEAGKALAKKLRYFAFHSDAIVLGLPRGGVPVAYEVATALHLPLDIFVVRKVGAPGHEEFAMGAIASGGISYINDSTVRQLGVSPGELDFMIEREKEEVERRMRDYGAESQPDFSNQTLILVDDGLATGSTIRAAVRALHQQHPREIIIAAPVAPRDTVQEFESDGEHLVVLHIPEQFYAVGEWYDDFCQTTDKEVRALLRHARHNFQESPAKPVIF